MKLLLLFLSLFTFIFSNDKEVENDMANGYYVYFVMNGGLPLYSPVYDVTEIPDLDDYIPYKSPTSEYSYEFGGWYYDAECTTQALTGDPITANTALYALWIGTQRGGYSITFVANGGTPIPNDLTNQTAIPDPLPSISKTGLTFAGWRWGNTSGSALVTPGEPIYADATIYAIWVANLYDITYNSNGGSAVSSNIGVTAFPSPLPTSTKAGSTFAGWWNSNFTTQYTAGQTIQGNITAYAKWIANSYTVTWVENGGTPAPDDLSDVAALPATLPEITKTGYELDGWYFNSLFTGTAATGGQLITQNETLYAKFVRVLYVIGYELDGGSNNLGNPDEYNVESPTITLLDPSKVGYTFGGWFSDEEMTTAITSIPTGTTGDITIYALFTLSETGYSITWVENGGTPEQTDLTNQNYLPSVLPALIKTGYVFKGWFTNEALTIAAAPSALIGENTTLYAKFEVQATPKKGYIRVEPIDTELSETSKMPLQNKAIYTELNLKVDKVADKSLVLDTEIAHLVALDTQAELDEKFGAKEDIANKGVANGYAPLNASGIVDPIYVPGAYTDYVEYATYADLPASGVEGTLYVVIADETSGGNTSTYRWTGSIYVNVTDKLSASEVKALYESNANTNAYTDAEKTKLLSIEAGAEINILEAINVEGESDLAITAKKSTIPLATDTISGALDKVDKAYIDNVRNGTTAVPVANSLSEGAKADITHNNLRSVITATDPIEIFDNQGKIKEITSNDVWSPSWTGSFTSVGRAKFSGTESCIFIAKTSNIAVFTIDQVIANNGVAESDTTTAASNLFIQKNVFTVDEEGFAISASTNKLSIGIDVSKLTGWDDGWTAAQKQDAFKTWLTTNNFIAFYKLFGITPYPTIANLTTWLSTGTPNIITKLISRGENLNKGIYQDLTSLDAFNLASNSRFVDGLTGWTKGANIVTYNISGNSFTYTVPGAVGSTGANWFSTSTNVAIANHKLLVSYYAKRNNSAGNNTFLTSLGYYNYSASHVLTTSLVKYNDIHTYTSDQKVVFGTYNETETGLIVNLYDIKIYDITALVASGELPSGLTDEQYIALLDAYTLDLSEETNYIKVEPSVAYKLVKASDQTNICYLVEYSLDYQTIKTTLITWTSNVSQTITTSAYTQYAKIVSNLSADNAIALKYSTADSLYKEYTEDVIDLDMTLYAKLSDKDKWTNNTIERINGDVEVKELKEIFSAYNNGQIEAFFDIVSPNILIEYNSDQGNQIQTNTERLAENDVVLDNHEERLDAIEEGTYASMYLADNTTPASIPNGSTFTPLAITMTGGMANKVTYSLSTPSITIQYAGVYRVLINFGIKVDTNSVTFTTAVFKNGAIMHELEQIRTAKNATDSDVSLLTALVVLNAGDVLTMGTKHDYLSAVALTIQNATFSINKIANI